MDRDERHEIDSLPEKYRPLGAWAYFCYSILFTIPLIGIISLIVFALSDKNINRRSFARSFFCGYIIAIVVIVLITVLEGNFLAGILQSIQQ